MVIAPNSLPTYIADGGNEVNYGVASIPSNTGESVSAGVMDCFMCFDNDYTDEEKAAITTFFDYFYDDDTLHRLGGYGRLPAGYQDWRRGSCCR